MDTETTSPVEGGDPGRMAVMPLGRHLEELRSRLIKCLVLLGVAFIACWLFRAGLLEVIKRPHVAAMAAYRFQTALSYRSYFEPLVAQVKMCIVAALVLTAPLIIFQVWAFVTPGLFPRERSKAVKLGLGCLLCFVAGICFGYFLFVPVALRCMVALAGPGTTPVLMIGDYLSLFALLTFAMGVAFQTPVVVYYLIRWRVMTIEGLQRRRRGVILAAFVAGAVLTPPDPLTQVMMAVTLIVLYDLGGLLAAPGRATFVSFFQFTGAILLCLAVFLAWFVYWPVGRVTAVRGTVRVDENALQQGQTVRLRRGSACRTDTDALANVVLAGSDGPVVHLAGDGRLQIHGRATLSLHASECLVESAGEHAELEIHAGPASIAFGRARAELRLLDPRALVVTVLDGEVQVLAQGQETQLFAGQTATFRQGGEPADVSEAERRWQQRLAGNKEDEPEPAP